VCKSREGEREGTRNDPKGGGRYRDRFRGWEVAWGVTGNQLRGGYQKAWGGKDWGSKRGGGEQQKQGGKFVILRGAKGLSGRVKLVKKKKGVVGKRGEDLRGFGKPRGKGCRNLRVTSLVTKLSARWHGGGPCCVHG